MYREINDEEQKKLVLRAVDRALNTSSFIYFSGAEIQGQRKLENYRPISRDEVEEYIRGCLDIIYNEMSKVRSITIIALTFLVRISER